ncbi:MAG: hypothetical protein J5802_01010 [Butyrivibrio sp.]|nr:hypothetical protein [Butyrivibrio sp.]
MKKSYLSIALLMSITLTACGTNASNPANVTSISVEDMPLSAEPTDEATNQDNANQTSNTFNPHVFSKEETMIWGEETRDSFFNLCDALLKGEDTFKCTDQNAYENCISGRLLNYYFPVAALYISTDSSSAACGFENGVGKINYIKPKEDFLRAEKEFESRVEKILNENIQPGYSPFEKALKMYVYMSENYTYDYEMNNSYDGTYEKINTYRSLMSSKGTDRELSGVYSYLMLQCGVDAGVIEGNNLSGSHQWSYVTIGKNEYHVDPSFGLSSPDLFDGSAPLDSFLMTDNVREERDGFPAANFILGGTEDNPQKTKVAAKDDTFGALRFGYFVEIDCDKNTVTYGSYDDTGYQDFHYED